MQDGRRPFGYNLTMTSAREIFLRDDAALFAAILKRAGESEEEKELFFDTPLPCPMVGEIKEDFRSDNAIFISKPLLLAFMFGAERCCSLALRSLPARALLRIREDAGNVLHALVIGSHHRLRPAAAFDAAVTALLGALSVEELRSLNARSGHLGLRPVELAVRMDQFQLSERLLCSGVLRKVGEASCGPNVIVTFDLGEYGPGAENSRFLVSPCALLSENLSLERLRAIQASGVLRSKSLFHVWEASMTQNSKWLSYSALAWTITAMIAMIFSGQSLTRKQIALACRHPNSQLPTPGDILWEYTAFIMVLQTCVSNLAVCITSLIGVYRFHKTHHEVNINQLIFVSICLQCCIPTFLLFIGFGVWGYALFSNPEAFCGSTDFYYLSIAIATVNMNYLYQTIYSFQIIKTINQFVTNFIDILSLFIPFLILEVLVIVVFARIFENVSYLQAIRLNETFNDGFMSDRQIFNGYTESLYTTFRLSLNIVDLSRASTDLMTMALHWAYVLVLPVMIFNYIIGVVSAKLSAMVAVREEKAILHRNRVSMFIFWQGKVLHTIINKLRKRQRKDYLTVYLSASDPCLRKASNEYKNVLEEQENSETLDTIQLQD